MSRSKFSVPLPSTTRISQGDTTLQCKLDSRCHSAGSSRNSNTLHFATRQMQLNYPVSKISTPSLLRSVSWDVKSDSLQPRQRGACKRGSRWRERETRLASEEPGRRRGEAGCKRGKEESPGKVGSSFLPCFSRCSPSDIERGYRMYSRYPSTYSSLSSPGPLALDGKH